MAELLVDSSVILDLFEEDHDWVEWSQGMLERYGATHDLWIDSVVYAEVSIAFDRIEDLEEALNGSGFRLVPIPREALFLAGKAFLSYRRRGGSRLSLLPDFFIGAHAAVAGIPLLTRDPARVRSYFPKVTLITPAEE